MSTEPKKQDPGIEQARAEPPLTLADDSRDGSTQPVPTGPGDTGDSRSGSPAPSPGSTEASGATTGGFDTVLGRLVVRAGLATQDEVETCATELSADTDPNTLADLLIAKDFLTQHQLGRLKHEFEAKNSGKSIPGYRLKKKLGSGAMANVYLARQLSLDRLVAIKILPKKFSSDEKFIERFHKEGRSAAQLNHANIVGAFDVGYAGENHYFVMEYVDGLTVHELIRERKRVPEAEAIDIVIQVGRALEHAHERGFIHRDIKPKNIMITKSGRVKLADLGLARALSDKESAEAEAGRAYGTPYYISPEQIRGEVDIAPAADIYGLGATFYHMVTGRVPFEGKNPSDVMHRHLKNKLEPPDHINASLSAGCAQVIEMMLAKKASDRYSNAADLIEDLELVAKGESPHFAHRSFDHAAIVESVAGAAPSPTVITPAPSKDANLFQDPIFLVILTILAISVILNLIQIVV